MTVLISLIIVTITGCAQLPQSKAKKTTPTERQAGATSENLPVGEKMLEGQVEVEESQGKLPPDFPDEFPIYEGSKVIQSLKTRGEQGKGFHIILETNGDQSVVADYYEKSLPENG